MLYPLSYEGDPGILPCGEGCIKEGLPFLNTTRIRVEAAAAQAWA
jgi:hypothetical protein